MARECVLQDIQLTNTQADARTSGKAAAGRDIQGCKVVPTRMVKMMVMETQQTRSRYVPIRQIC